MEGLREAIKEASEKLKEKEVRLNVVNFPFTDVEDIRAVMTMEKCDGDQSWVIGQVGLENQVQVQVQVRTYTCNCLIKIVFKK